MIIKTKNLVTRTPPHPQYQIVSVWGVGGRGYPRCNSMQLLSRSGQVTITYPQQSAMGLITEKLYD